MVVFLEKFEKLRHCPRPGLEPRTERKSKILSYKTPGMSGIATVYVHLRLGFAYSTPHVYLLLYLLRTMGSEVHVKSRIKELSIS